MELKECSKIAHHLLNVSQKLLNDAEDLNWVISMYNLLAYSSKYTETTDGLWFYYRDEPVNSENCRFQIFQV